MSNDLNALSQSNTESLEAQKKVVREVYIARKIELETANSLDNIIEEELWIKRVTTNLYVRYLVDGLTDEEYKTALPTIFGELPVEKLMSADEYMEREMEQSYSYCEFNKELNIESLPGQYDDVVDATQQCLMLQTGNQNHNVRTFTTIGLHGNISDKDMEKIKKYLINPVDKQHTELSDKILLRDLPSPENVKILDGFTDLDKEWLQKFIKEYGLAMNVDDLDFAQQYFSGKWRNPTVAEIKVLDTYRSDHCRHGTFNTEIGEVKFDMDGILFSWNKKYMEEIGGVQKKYEDYRKELGREDKPNTLMELATLWTKYLKAHPEINPNIKNIVESDEINACTFKTTVEMEDGTTEEREIMFKNETHNHPTEIEPFWWAATCLWWCIRDPLSGRSWVFQAMRVTWAADPTAPISETLSGKLAQSVISRLSALGYSSYGNQMGIHAGQVKQYFHKWYLAKRFEIGYVIAGAPASYIRREKPVAWDKVIMIWGKTGRDGVWWASTSSVGHDTDSVATMWASVQKGNPVEERKLARLFHDPKFTKFVKRCNDFWAWWVSVAIWELTRWLHIDLDKVPTKYSWLDGTELAISESQERMAIVIGPEDYDEVMKLIQEYNLEWTDVAQVTDNVDTPTDDRLIMKWRGENIVDIDRDFLDMAGAKRTMERIKINVKDNLNLNPIPTEVQSALENNNIEWAFLETLGRLSVASQKWLWSIFDNSVGWSNVLAMQWGKYQETPQEWMVSKIPTFNGVDAKTVTISTHGFNPELASESAYLGAINAIKLAVSKQVALWWDYKTMRLSLQEYFGKLKDDPERWWECYGALLWAFKAQYELWIAAIGGKDSMSGTFKTKEGDEINVPPGVVAFAANMWNIDHIVSAEFKKPGNEVRYFPASQNRDEYKAMLEYIQDLNKQWIISASSVIESWWLAANIAKMSFGNNIWFNGYIEQKEDWFTDDLWWIVLEIAPDKKNEDLTYHLHKEFSYYKIGDTIAEKNIKINWKNIKMENALQAYKWTHEKTHPTTSWGWNVNLITPSEKAKTRNNLIEVSETWLAKNFNIMKWLKPKVIIPVFSGTNSELDTAHQVRKAWMEAVEFIFNNQTPELLMESTRKFAELLNDADMVVFPWWFSAWDQPHGSAKFIASIFRMNIVRDAMQRFLDKPDTLTLWICNGFQALIKLWVFDASKITDHLTEYSPTLTYNTTGRHMTDQVGLQITSILSPMTSWVDIWDTFIIPISHGEGRIYMKDKETLEKYIRNGQVVMQYLDVNGKPTSQYNWSLEWIAALCSPDGRILGMMPHPERTGLRLFQNIPGNHDFPIFRSAAKAFGVKWLIYK